MIDKDLLDMQKCREDLLFNRKGDRPFHLMLSAALAYPCKYFVWQGGNA